MTFDPNAHKISRNYQTIYDRDKFHERFDPHPLRHHNSKAEKYLDA